MSNKPRHVNDTGIDVTHQVQAILDGKRHQGWDRRVCGLIAGAHGGVDRWAESFISYCADAYTVAVIKAHLAHRRPNKRGLMARPSGWDRKIEGLIAKAHGGTEIMAAAFIEARSNYEPEGPLT
jgi:hypothetical protein